MPEPWWWLSFTDRDKPVGTQFLGGCWVQGASLHSAVQYSVVLGINPGGECNAFETPTNFIPPDKWAERLLQLDDIQIMNHEMT